MIHKVRIRPARTAWPYGIAILLTLVIVHAIAVVAERVECFNDLSHDGSSRFLPDFELKGECRDTHRFLIFFR